MTEKNRTNKNIDDIEKRKEATIEATNQVFLSNFGMTEKELTSPGFFPWLKTNDYHRLILNSMRFDMVDRIFPALAKKFNLKEAAPEKNLAQLALHEFAQNDGWFPGIGEKAGAYFKSNDHHIMKIAVSPDEKGNFVVGMINAEDLDLPPGKEVNALNIRSICSATFPETHVYDITDGVAYLDNMAFQMSVSARFKNQNPTESPSA